LNVNAPGLSRIRGAVAVTFKVTLRLTGLFAAPLAVNVTVPVYVPIASPEGFTLTLNAPGVLPLPGVAESHAPVVRTL
jgi:hypothetical protein